MPTLLAAPKNTEKYKQSFSELRKKPFTLS